MSVSGSLQDVNVGGLFRLFSLHEFTGRLEIRGATRQLGNLYLKQGTIIAADFKAGRRKARGEAAVYKILSLSKGDFRLVEKSAVPGGACRVNRSTENLILEGIRRLSPSTDFDTLLPPLGAILELAAIARDRALNITLLPEEWNLLVSLNGRKTLAHLLNDRGNDRKDTMRSLYALISVGLVKKARFKLPNLKRMAEKALGPIGGALVDSEIDKLKVRPTRMTMHHLLDLLRGLGKSMAEIVGAQRSEQIVKSMWDEVKT